MPLKKGFLKNDSSLFRVTKARTLLGLILGFGHSLSLYLLLYFGREAFRVTSAVNFYDLWVLTNDEVSFYNLVFALIAVVYGQSVTFSFWLNRRKKYREKKFHKKLLALTDQTFLSWNFLAWFVKLGVVFGLWFGTIIIRGYYTFSLSPDWDYLFLLFPIVLFLQSWTTIISIYKRRAQKWMMITAPFLFVLAFAYSKIDLVDHESINHNYLQNNIHYNYNLNLPEWDGEKSYLSRSLTEDIYLVFSKGDTADANPKIIVRDSYQELKEVTLIGLKEFFEYKRSQIDPFLKDRLICNLNIHESIKMGFVNQVKNELSKAGIRKIAFAYIPKDRKYDKRYYNGYQLSFVLPNWNYESFEPSLFRSALEVKNVIRIGVQDTQYLVNDSIVTARELKTRIKRLMKEIPEFKVHFYINDDDDFQDYFTVISDLIIAIAELREEYALIKYQKSYDQLDSDEYSDVNSQYLLRYLGVTEELLRRIESRN